MPEPIYDTSAPVLVTGATGYVAGWLIKRLLEEGFTTHAAVRNPGNEAKRAHLDRIAADTPGSIHYFAADLLDQGSFAEAMAGCRVVFHTASPFSARVDDPQRDLVDPALEGTRNVLASVNQTPSVERVVLTSSCAAIYGDNADVAQAPGGTLTEAQWNETSSLDHQPYSYSKTVAERAAWEMAGQQDRWRLVVVNPSLVVGPALQSKPTSESFNLIKSVADGTMKAGAPPFQVGMVDVRDVAEAHLRAAFVPDAEGRHITSKESHTFLDLANMLRGRFGEDWPFPKRELPKWLVWAVGPLVDRSFTRRFIAANAGIPWRADHSKSVEKLGLTYGSIERAVTDMFEQMIEAGMIKKP